MFPRLEKHSSYLVLVISLQVRYKVAERSPNENSERQSSDPYTGQKETSAPRKGGETSPPVSTSASADNRSSRHVEERVAAKETVRRVLESAADNRDGGTEAAARGVPLKCCG